MTRTWIAAMAVAAALAAPAAAQNASSVVGTASKAMGVEGLNSIHYYGVGQQGSLGQNNNANMPWPLTPLNEYVRAIDFTQPASRATARTWAVSVITNRAAEGAFNQVVTPASTSWADQLEIWTTPWGFLKAAAANNATVRSRTLDGRRYQEVSFNAPVKSPGGQPYRVVGLINNQNLVERTQTWLDHSVFGDMLVETDFSLYRDTNGLKYPTRIVQKRAGWPVYDFQILGAHANPPNLQALMTPPPAAGRGGGPAGAPPAGGAGRGAGATPPPPPAPYAEQLAPGVFRIGQKPAAGTYSALAVEFNDHIVLFEPGPASVARADAIIAETKRAIPNKPIRFGAISHHHIDHTGGLAAAVAEGITIVTPEVNRAFIMSAMSTPRTLAPDGLAKSGRKPQVQGFQGDKHVFTDGTRTFELHVIKGLPHADGLVVGYLPKERILIYADMFNLPAAAEPVPNPPVRGTGVLADNIERLGLTPERIVSVHALDQQNDGRMTTLAEIRASLGRK